jgi:hypothetical protein
MILIGEIINSNWVILRVPSLTFWKYDNVYEYGHQSLLLDVVLVAAK